MQSGVGQLGPAGLDEDGGCRAGHLFGEPEVLGHADVSASLREPVEQLLIAREQLAGASREVRVNTDPFDLRGE
jgi:hypothetical protein